MNVLHLVPAPFGGDGVYGGAERYALELSKAMALVTPTRLVSFGPKHRSIEHPCGLKEFVLGNSWYVRGQRFNPFHIGIFKHLLWADVIHCHQNNTFYAEISAIFGRFTCRKVFGTDLGGGGWGLNSFIPTTRIFNAHLHISEYSKNLAGQCGNKQSFVIYGGVDSQKFSPGILTKKKNTAVIVGRILPHKGLDLAIKELPENMTLEICGRIYNSEYYIFLQNLVSNKRVNFYLDSSDDFIIDKYRQSLCVIMPSVHRDWKGNETKVPELLGQTLIEGMACGIPGVASNVASLPEIISDGYNGKLFDPNKPGELKSVLLFFLNNDYLIPKMGIAARSTVVSKFLWSNVVTQCLEIYRSV